MRLVEVSCFSLEAIFFLSIHIVLYLNPLQRNNQNGKQDPNASVQNLASRAASRAKIEAAKNISPPNSAYQFELSWRGFSGDRALQARFLKVIITLSYFMDLFFIYLVITC